MYVTPIPQNFLESGEKLGKFGKKVVAFAISVMGWGILYLINDLNKMARLGVLPYI